MNTVLEVAQTCMFILHYYPAFRLTFIENYEIENSDIMESWKSLQKLAIRLDLCHVKLAAIEKQLHLLVQLCIAPQPNPLLLSIQRKLGINARINASTPLSLAMLTTLYHPLQGNQSKHWVYVLEKVDPKLS